LLNSGGGLGLGLEAAWARARAAAVFDDKHGPNQKK
jgi:hypothetical protein